MWASSFLCFSTIYLHSAVRDPALTYPAAYPEEEKGRPRPGSRLSTGASHAFPVRKPSRSPRMHKPLQGCRQPHADISVATPSVGLGGDRVVDIQASGWLTSDRLRKYLLHRAVLSTPAGFARMRVSSMFRCQQICFATAPGLHA